MAIAIADGWQHHGLGRAMLARAIAWARDHGVAELQRVDPMRPTAR